MTTMTVERETIHRMIDALPTERENVLFGVYELLLEEDDEPLSADELEQLELAYKEIAAGHVSPWEDVKARLAALP